MWYHDALHRYGKNNELSNCCMSTCILVEELRANPKSLWNLITGKTGAIEVASSHWLGFVAISFNHLLYSRPGRSFLGQELLSWKGDRVGFPHYIRILYSLYNWVKLGRIDTNKWLLFLHHVLTLNIPYLTFMYLGWMHLLDVALDKSVS